ncbi:intein N-terminal splicing region [Thioclava dalianensis]|nr:intein N-terminal splicing region [Thioclava dalianensis]
MGLSMSAADPRIALTGALTGTPGFAASVFQDMGCVSTRSLRLEFDGNDKERGVLHGYDGQGCKLYSGSIAEALNVIPCFTQDARIATETGDMPVSRLRAGMRVMTRDNGLQVLRWSGTRSFDWRALGLNPFLRPVRLQASVLGADLPDAEITVSPNHRLLTQAPARAQTGECLVMARDLVGLDGVELCACTSITYYQLLFDRHELIMANGIWSESFRPTADALAALRPQTLSELHDILPGRDVEALYAPVRPDARG